MKTRIFFSICLVLTLCAVSGLLRAQQVQWAHQVVGVSSEISMDGSLAHEVLGFPNSESEMGQSFFAWAPAKEDAGNEYIHVRFKTGIKAQQVAIYECLGAGSIREIELIDVDGKKYEVYKNKQPALANRGLGRVFYHFFPMTPKPIIECKLTLDTDLPGWQQIDAIAISDSRTAIDYKINLVSYANAIPTPQNLGPLVNSGAAERLPIISHDGNFLWFARKYHPDNMGKDRKDDIWYSEPLNGQDKWGLAQNPGAPLNNDDHNFVITPSPDGQRLYLANEYRGSAKDGVSLSTWNGRDWSKPRAMDIPGMQNKSKYVDYHVSSDERFLLMTVERDGGMGDRDIFACKRLSDFAWSEPRNLGPDINTVGMEAGVFLAADMKTLYFCSSGHEGYGGLDLFITTRLDDSWQRWSKPKNLGPKINTRSNEYCFSLPAKGDWAYFSSGPYTSSDLYRIRLPREIQPEPVTIITGNIVDEDDAPTPTSKPSVAAKPNNNTTPTKPITTATGRPLNPNNSPTTQPIAQASPKATTPKPRQYTVIVPADKKAVSSQPQIPGYYVVSPELDKTGQVNKEIDYDGNDPTILEENKKATTPKPIASNDPQVAQMNKEVDALQAKLAKLQGDVQNLEAKRDQPRTYSSVPATSTYTQTSNPPPPSSSKPSANRPESVRAEEPTYAQSTPTQKPNPELDKLRAKFLKANQPNQAVAVAPKPSAYDPDKYAVQRQPDNNPNYNQMPPPPYQPEPQVPRVDPEVERMKAKLNKAAQPTQVVKVEPKPIDYNPNAYVVKRNPETMTPSPPNVSPSATTTTSPNNANQVPPTPSVAMGENTPPTPPSASKTDPEVERMKAKLGMASKPQSSTTTTPDNTNQAPSSVSMGENTPPTPPSASKTDPEVERMKAKLGMASKPQNNTSAANNPTTNPEIVKIPNTTEPSKPNTPPETENTPQLAAKTDPELEKLRAKFNKSPAGGNQPTSTNNALTQNKPTGGVGHNDFENKPTGGVGHNDFENKPTGGVGHNNFENKPTGGVSQNTNGKPTGGVGHNDFENKPTGSVSQNTNGKPTGGVGHNDFENKPSGGVGHNNFENKPTGGVGHNNFENKPTGGVGNGQQELNPEEWNNFMANVRQDMENKMRDDVRKDLQNKLMGEVKQELAKDLEPELQEQLRGEMKDKVEKNLRAELEKNVQSDLRKQMEGNVRTELQDKMRGQVADELRDKMRKEIETELRKNMQDQVKADLEAQMRDQIRDALKREMELQLKREMEAKIRKELDGQLRKQNDQILKDRLAAQNNANANAPKPIAKPEYLEITQDVKAVPIKIGQIIPLNNIYFDANKASIKEESYNELQKVLDFLRAQDKLVVEIGGHTNGLCSDLFAVPLSEDRSKAVRDYLVGNGIPNSRILFKGYGKTAPIAPDNTIDGRKKNQRVEMKIVEIKN